MNATIVSLTGLRTVIGAACAALLGRARRAVNLRSKRNRGRSSHPAPTSALLPSLLHPLAFDATASEFDDIPRRRFMPVNSLSEHKEGEASASAKSF